MRLLRSLAVAASMLPASISSGAAPIMADHRAVERWALIPPEYLPRAAAVRLMFRHASVGTTLDDGLNCMQGTRENPVECRLYPDYRYDRRQWAFQPRGNVGWYGKVDDFVAAMESQLDLFDAFSFKYCYLDGLDGLAEPCGSPQDPAKIAQAWEYLQSALEALEAAHPDKTIVWWTIPLTQVGQSCTEALNGLIRTYAREEGKPLFDIADIECHDAAGARHTNAQGWEIALQEFCGEQGPDAQACHPNWPGKLRLAKAWWYLMARVAGWEDGAARAPFLRGDANADGGVNVADAVFVLARLFAGGGAPPCADAADANDDGAIDISDAGMVLLHLFGTAPRPFPAPASACGGDPSDDPLGCAAFGPCG